MSEDKNKLVVFQEKGIRRIWYKDEWKKRGVQEGMQNSILTAEIAK